jgi:hypothetical protein
MSHHTAALARANTRARRLANRLANAQQQADQANTRLDQVRTEYDAAKAIVNQMESKER